MSKFGGNDYLINVHEINTSQKSKDIITRSAKKYIDYSHIPLNRRFTNREAEVGGDVKFTMVSGTSLQACNRTDKLFIFGHGDVKSVGAAESAGLMAWALKGWGLKEIGLVTFKACHVAEGNFLEDFVTKAAKQCGICIGWAKGYKGSSTTWLDGQKKPHETIDQNDNVLGEDAYQEQGGVKQNSRVKIVRGPNNTWSIALGAGRYTGPVSRPSPWG
jgi:hypothetical protein